MIRFGRYQADEVWREEPLGRVLRGRLPDAARSVLLLELAPPPHLPGTQRQLLVRRFSEDARALARLDDARLPKPWDFGETERGTLFLAFERPESAGYQPLPTQPRQWMPECWLAVAAECARAVPGWLEHGLRPLGFDPGSLWVAPTGNVRLLPLTLAGYAAELQLPLGPDVPGAAFLAPEVRRGEEPGPAAIVFSLAAWLYTMLAGGMEHCPADGAAAGGVPRPIWEHEPSLRAGVSDALQAALSADPRRRPPTPRQFAALLGVEGPRPLAIPRREEAEDDEAVPAGESWLPAAWPAYAVSLAVLGTAVGFLLQQLTRR